MKKLSKQYKKLEQIFVVILLIIIPLYPKFPLLSVPGTYVAIRIEDLIIAAICIYLIAIYSSKIRKISNISMIKAYIIYIAVGITSLMSAVLITNTVQPLLGFLHLLRRVQYFVPFIIGYLAIKNRSIEKTFIIKTLFLVVFMVFAYGLGQKYLNWPIIVTQNREYAKGIALRSIPGGHLNSTFAGHYDLASYMILVTPIFLVFFANNFNFRNLKNVSFISVLVVLVGTWLVGISGSRISTISFLATGLVSLILIKKFKIIPFFLIFAILVFSLSNSLVTRYQRLIEVGTAQFQNVMNKLRTNSGESFVVYAQDQTQDFPEKRKKPDPTPTPAPVLEDRSTSIRLNIEWPRAIRAFYKNPILGTGFSSITLATDNDYLRLLGELGIFGVLSFSTIFIILFKSFIEAIRVIKKFSRIEIAFIVGCSSSLLGVFINAAFIDIFEASKFAITFWLLQGLTFSLITDKLRK
ncbi:O-antigen ligase family protein [Candidatus Woesebacteria bacterium]|nr:O-antigen ligase family protein [Candidatus Woesebacteria bacterium]